MLKNHSIHTSLEVDDKMLKMRHFGSIFKQDKLGVVFAYCVLACK